MALESQLRVRWRLAMRADLAQCLELLPPWLRLDESVRVALPSIWAKHLHESWFNAVAFEDASGVSRGCLLGFGMSIALNRAWQDRLRDDPPPFIAARIYQELLDGSFTPPGDAELGAMNAAGNVAFLALHYVQRHELGSPDGLAVLAVGAAAMRTVHCGFRLRRLFQEATEAESVFLRNFGFKAYTRRSATSGHPPGAPALPQLYGLSRDEAADLLPGTLARDVFPFTPPVIGFSAAERRLLRLAVTDLPDDRIADELGLSTYTVKNLWVAIHRRVEARLPNLYKGAASESDPPYQPNRGPEKRRILIPYLRQRPEELRPYLP